METWMFWLALAGIVVILELFTGTFYLLMIALGLVAGALVALMSTSMQIQMLIAALVGSVATITLHTSRFGWRARGEASRDPNVNIDIGQELKVEAWQDQGNGKYFARTKYRGALWDVELRHAHGLPGTYVIDEVQGSRLIVKPSV
jgi:membrane protein implicated in regulation of membrane protease activity